MTREELMKTVDLTEDNYIAEAAVPPAKKNIFGFPGVKTALAVAACLAVFLLAGLILKNGATPTHTDAPTSDGFSASETEETTEKERTTKKNTEPTEEPAAEIVVPPTQRPTEPPTEEPSEHIMKPSSQPTTADVTEPSTENTAPTAPTEKQTEETTVEEPPTEPTTAEEPTGKTIGDILSALGLFDSIAGEGELLGVPEQPEEQVFTQLTEKEIAAVFGFSPSERLVIPDGYSQEETLFGKTEKNGRQTFHAVYAFAKETDVVYLVLQKGDTAFSPELFDTPPVCVNDADVYRMTEYDDHTDGTETYRNCLAAFGCGGLTCVVFGSGTSVTAEELLIFAGNLLPPA